MWIFSKNNLLWVINAIIIIVFLLFFFINCSDRNNKNKSYNNHTLESEYYCQDVSSFVNDNKFVELDNINFKVPRINKWIECFKIPVLRLFVEKNDKLIDFKVIALYLEEDSIRKIQNNDSFIFDSYFLISILKQNVSKDYSIDEFNSLKVLLVNKSNEIIENSNNYLSTVLKHDVSDSVFIEKVYSNSENSISIFTKTYSKYIMPLRININTFTFVKNKIITFHYFKYVSESEYEIDRFMSINDKVVNQFLKNNQ
jgi:hypothetical protein